MEIAYKLIVVDDTSPTVDSRHLWVSFSFWLKPFPIWKVVFKIIFVSIGISSLKGQKKGQGDMDIIREFEDMSTK